MPVISPGSVTIWDDNTDAIATRRTITAYTEPDGEDPGGEPIFSDPIPLARISGPLLGFTASDWARGQWTPEQRADPAGTGARNFRAGERILDVVNVKPSLGQYDRLGTMGAGEPDLDAGTITYTWSKISAEEFDPETHLPPVWDDDSGAWQPPVAKTLVAKKAEKIAALKAKVGTLIAAGFAYSLPGSPEDPHVYQIDDSAQGNMLAVYVEHLDGAENPHGGYWRDRANVNVSMSGADNKAFLEAAKAYKMGIIRRAQALTDAIADAADHAVLDLINIAAGSVNGEGGWP